MGSAKPAALRSAGRTRVVEWTKRRSPSYQDVQISVDNLSHVKLVTFTPGFRGFHFSLIQRLREKPCRLLSFLSLSLSLSYRPWSMEDVFSDTLGLFGGENEEDDGYVCRRVR